MSERNYSKLARKRKRDSGVVINIHGDPKKHAQDVRQKLARDAERKRKAAALKKRKRLTAGTPERTQDEDRGDLVESIGRMARSFALEWSKK